MYVLKSAEERAAILERGVAGARELVQQREANAERDERVMAFMGRLVDACRDATNSRGRVEQDGVTVIPLRHEFDGELRFARLEIFDRGLGVIAMVEAHSAEPLLPDSRPSMVAEISPDFRSDTAMWRTVRERFEATPDPSSQQARAVGACILDAYKLDWESTA